MSFKPPQPPEGCTTVEAHERALTTIADEMEAKARALLARDGDRISTATAKEMFLGAIRSRKIAAELARYREDVAHTNYLIDQQRMLAGVHRGDRPRLRRKDQP